MFRERRVVFVFNVYSGKEGLFLFSMFIPGKKGCCYVYSLKISYNNNRVDFFIFKNFFPVKFFFTSAISLH